jgi:hypothetical protein
MKNLNNLLILIFILILLGIFYKKIDDKISNDIYSENYYSIQKYLLDDKNLGKIKKPILWIHVPYEYNSRNWLSFGSRTSFDLNQPYLYLTLRTIIKYCDQSFQICLIDDNSFSKLIPNWNINMNIISNPISCNIRLLGMMQLLYLYGGMFCPLSFVCMKDLIDMYNIGTRENKMFVCETINRNSSSLYSNFSPYIYFSGSNKDNPIIKEFINFIQINSSHNMSTDTQFLGLYNNWLNDKIDKKLINIIDGQLIGTKTIDDKQIILDDLMSNNYLNIYTNTYGIFIDNKELNQRIQYGWFIRMSPKQVLESDTIIGNYLLLSITPNNDNLILEPLQIKPNWVGFWKTPLYPGIFGLKPNFLGDNLEKLPYPGK